MRDAPIPRARAASKLRALLRFCCGCAHQRRSFAISAKLCFGKFFRHFWELYGKELELDESKIALRLIPSVNVNRLLEPGIMDYREDLHCALASTHPMVLSRYTGRYGLAGMLTELPALTFGLTVGTRRPGSIQCRYARSGGDGRSYTLVEVFCFVEKQGYDFAVDGFWYWNCRCV